MEQLGVVAGNFVLSFSLIFLSIFVNISGSIRRSLWSRHHWKVLFLLQKLSIDNANFGQKWWRQKWNKGPGSPYQYSNSILIPRLSGQTSIFGNWETKETLKIYIFGPESLRAMLEYWYIKCGLFTNSQISLIRFNIHWSQRGTVIKEMQGIDWFTKSKYQ